MIISLFVIGPIIFLIAGIIISFMDFGDQLDNIKSPCGVRIRDSYQLCEEHKRSFFENGLLILPNLLTNKELSEIELIYNQYMRDGSYEKQGRDFCDMSKPYDTPRDKYSVINAMLPRKYYPQLQGNIY